MEKQSQVDFELLFDFFFVMVLFAVICSNDAYKMGQLQLTTGNSETHQESCGISSAQNNTYTVRRFGKSKYL